MSREKHLEAMLDNAEKEIEALREIIKLFGHVDMIVERQALYDVAVGNIEKPLFEIEVDGEVQIFEGRYARCFAFGMLTGLRSAQNKCEFELEIK